MASIGLTIPAIAIASIWLDGPLELGLNQLQSVLLILTAAVAILTVVPGRAKPLQGGVHLVLLAAFLFLTSRRSPPPSSMRRGPAGVLPGRVSVSDQPKYLA